MGDDQLRLRVEIDEPRELAGDRRQPSPAVDQDRHPPLRGEREDRAEALVLEEEALRARVQLDPAGAGIEAPLRLLDRVLAEVEPDERDQPSLRAAGVLERAVVRSAEGRMTVGLVHAEHEGALDAVAVEHCDQVLVDAAEAVDVVAEVNVGVEEGGLRRQLAAELVVVGRQQSLSALERVRHER